MPAQLRNFYEAEARELIDRLTRAAATLGGAPGTERDALADMLRAAHTLKGAAHVVGEKSMAALAHGFEDAVALYRQDPPGASVAVLLSLADGLAAELAGGGAKAAIPPAGEPAAETAPAAPLPGPSGTESSSSSQPTALYQGSQPVANEHSDVHSDAHPEAERSFSQPVSAPVATLRVETAETSRLLDQVSVSGAMAERMRATLRRLEAIEGTGSVESRRLERADLRRIMADDLSRLERALRDIYGTAQHLQLGEAETLLLETGRIVRAAAAAEGKQVQTVTSGGSERVDARILQALGDAQIHLLRNAVAHGIEPPAERLHAGKPPTGTVQVSMERRGAELQLVCADDGRGIPLDRIRQVAVQRGILSAASAQQAGDPELLALLLRPGFSLRDHVDGLSGRGVGLDAVHEAIESVGGRISIRSLAGQGTTFTLSLPSTVSALLALEVSAGGVRYLLPAAAVEHTLRMEPHHTVQVQGMRSLRVGLETMSFLWLQDALPDPGHSEAFDSGSGTQAARSAVILKAGDRRLALGVDRVEGLNDILLRPLPAWTGADATVAGAALGASGVPVLVLEPDGLASLAEARRALAMHAPQATAESALPVLVIDDSLTTRMLEQSILEAEGYEVDLAVSAEQGIEKARARHYGLFLVDVEMPGMNGFEFVRTTREDPVLRQTPAILVTSLDSAESRERGRAAGAASYIVKGEFNQGIYLDRIRRILAGKTANGSHLAAPDRATANQAAVPQPARGSTG